MEVRSEEGTYDVRGHPERERWVLETNAILGAVVSWLLSWPPAQPFTRLRPPAVHFQDPIWGLFLDGEAARLGLTTTQQLIVIHFIRHGDEPPTTTQLAEALGIERRSVNKAIAGLVRMGLVARGPASRIEITGLRDVLKRLSTSRASRT